MTEWKGKDNQKPLHWGRLVYDSKETITVRVYVDGELSDVIEVRSGDFINLPDYGWPECTVRVVE